MSALFSEQQLEPQPTGESLLNLRDDEVNRLKGDLVEQMYEQRKSGSIEPELLDKFIDVSTQSKINNPHYNQPPKGDISDLQDLRK